MYIFVAIIAAIAVYFGYEAEFATVSLPSDGVLRVHYIDVGQADATLLIYNEYAMLIDAGDNATSRDVVRYLQRQGVTALKYVIATHPHSDHIGGMAGVINAFEIETFIMPRVSHTTATFERMIDAIEGNNLNVKAPVPGEVLPFGSAHITVIAPNGDFYDNINNHSVAVRVELGETAFIFTGDAEAISEREMVAEGRSLSARVLKTGHHGSRTSTTAEFLAAVNPEIAVISCGLNNSYGHPHRDVLERLEAANIRIYRTDLQGNIIIETDGRVLNVITER